jgi:hypothetical protein
MCFQVSGKGGGCFSRMSIKYYRVSIDAVAKKLRDILGGLPEVKIAVLFGSALRRSFVRDVDVGVYVDPEPSLKDFVKLSCLIEDALGMPVDVVPLEKAPPKLRLAALMGGVKLVVRDKRLYDFLVSKALSEASDMDLKLEKVK